MLRMYSAQQIEMNDQMICTFAHCVCDEEEKSKTK